MRTGSWGRGRCTAASTGRCSPPRPRRWLAGPLSPVPVRQAIGCLEPQVRCLEEPKDGSIVTIFSRDPVISMSATLQLDGQSQVPQVESQGGGIGPWDEGYSYLRRR